MTRLTERVKCGAGAESDNDQVSKEERHVGRHAYTDYVCISTLLSPGYGAGPSPLSTSRVYDGDDPASLSGAVPATYTSSMHRDQPRTNIAYI